jgi:hypothetical protein
MPKRADLQSIFILGSGPIVIGQAAGLITAAAEAGCRRSLMIRNTQSVLL